MLKLALKKDLGRLTVRHTGKNNRQDSLQQAESVGQLTESLRFIEQEGLQKLSADGPYWLGEEISLVDLTYYPWFEQISVLEHFRGFQFPEGLDRLKHWWRTVANRESVRAIAKPQKFYLEHYGRLLQLKFPGD